MSIQSQNGSSVNYADGYQFLVTNTATPTFVVQTGATIPIVREALQAEGVKGAAATGDSIIFIQAHSVFTLEWRHSTKSNRRADPLAMNSRQKEFVTTPHDRE